MSIYGGAIPDLHDGFDNDCTRPDREICSTEKDIQKMRHFLRNAGGIPPKSDSEVVTDVMRLLRLKKESEIYESPAYQRIVGAGAARQSLFENFLAIGPRNSTALLSDTNIDHTLMKWSSISETEYEKKFYHVPFQMIDFYQTQTELAKLNLNELINKGYDCMGVVINTDVSTGRGIHWFCLYVDLSSNPITVEYFNSSGFPPRSEVVFWMEQAAMELRKKGKDVKIINATNNRQIQNSKTECGVWSLVYILSRLKGKDPNWIVNTNVDDDDMIQFRKRLFRVS